MLLTLSTVYLRNQGTSVRGYTTTFGIIVIFTGTLAVSLALSYIISKMQHIHHLSGNLTPRNSRCGLSRHELLPKCQFLRSRQLSSSKTPAVLSSVDAHPENKSQDSPEVPHATTDTTVKVREPYPTEDTVWTYDRGYPHHEELFEIDIVEPGEWDTFAMGELYCRDTKLPMAIYASSRQFDQPIRVLVSKQYGDHHWWDTSEHSTPLSAFYHWHVNTDRGASFCHSKWNYRFSSARILTPL